MACPPWTCNTCWGMELNSSGIYGVLRMQLSKGAGAWVGESLPTEMLKKKNPLKSRVGRRHYD
eukprot:1161824-Pelagomonas_calceolata.AAC.4